MKDFNLHGYLRNNRLLNESIGGYRDIKALREDDEFDQWCQENPEDCKRYKQSQEDADKAFTDKFGSYSSDETNEAESMTADPGWEYNDDDDVSDQQSENDFDQLLPTDQDLPGNDDSEYAAHMQHHSDLESQVMEIVSDLMNGGVDNKEIAIWLRDIANDIAGEMMEGGLEEKKPVSDDQRKAIWASYNNEAKETDVKEKPKAKGKLKEGKTRPSSSEFIWDI
jgi:hypothetical protein